MVVVVVESESRWMVVGGVRLKGERRRDLMLWHTRVLSKQPTKFPLSETFGQRPFKWRLTSLLPACRSPGQSMHTCA